MTEPPLPPPTVFDKKYQIEDWMGTISYSDQPTPSFYVKPDLLLLDFSKANDNKIRVKITDTNSEYDNRVFFAIVDKSSNIPNCRPNFFDATNLYVLTLDASWTGYPPNQGNFQVINTIMDGKTNVPIFGYITPEGFEITDDDKKKYLYIFFVVLLLSLITVSIMK